MVILDDKEDGVDKEMDGIETCMDDDEGTEEEQKGQTNISGEGDPDWTPEEAEHAYQQAGDDNCDQKPNPRYKTLKLLLVCSSITITTTLLLIIITIINLI